MPPRLVGRATELAELKAALEGAVRGEYRRVVISGEPGVGKTALIGELRSAANAGDGWFVSGAFDRHRRDRQFDAVWQVFHEIGRLLLAEPEESLAAVRDRLREGLGDDAALVAAVQPEFGVLMWVHPDLSQTDVFTLQGRLERAGVEILRAVASPERPLVLAMDDLQWAGQASLGVVDRLMQERNLVGVLLVLGLGSGDRSANHPLTRTVSRWSDPQAAIPCRHLRLENLPAAGLAELLAETLQIGSRRSSQLAELVAPATRGNPYDTIEVLNSLRHDGVLRSSGSGWRWDTAALKRYLDRADVTRLLADRAATMPAETQTLLRAMSCLGGRIDATLLQAATGLPADHLERLLARPLDEGLLMTGQDQEGSLRFRHDLVQEAILGDVEPEDMRVLRLTIARNLADRPDLLMEAAEQYLPVVDMVTQPQERAGVAGLLRRAAEHAQPLGGHRMVVQCTASAARLTDPSDASALTQLGTARIEALYGLGRLDETDEVYQEILAVGPTPMERVDATLVQISSLTIRNRPWEAVQLGLELLNELSCPAPGPDHLEDVVDGDLEVVYEWVGNGGCDLTAGEFGDRRSSPAVNNDAAEVAEPAVHATCSIINRLVSPSYFHDHRILAWLVVQAWRLWQEHGPHHALVEPLSHFPFVTISRRQDYRTGQRILRWVVAVGKARGYLLEAAQGTWLRAVTEWSVDSLEACTRLAIQGRDGLVKGGDLHGACLTYHALITSLMDSAPTLDSCGAEIDAGLALAQRLGSDQMIDMLDVHRRTVDALKGDGRVPSIKDIGVPGQYGTNPLAVVRVHVGRAMVAAIMGDRAELATQSAAAQALLPAMVGSYLTAVTHVLRALALSEDLRASRGETDHLAAELDGIVEWVAERATESPTNFLHLLRFLEAERAWANGDFRAASTAFDAAAEAATRHRPWHQALILERSARFLLAHGMRRGAFRNLAEAREIYHGWGATGKVRQLDWAYPTLQPAPAGRTMPAGRSPVPGTADLQGIHAASLALSSETSIEGLRRRVVDILSSMTGASHVHLLLRSDEGTTWLVTVPDSGDLLSLDEAVAKVLVGASAVRYAERTKEPLVVNDATRDDRFRRDPYFAPLEHCSLLAVPILHRGRTDALLMLENRLICGAFTAERLDSIVLIAGQLAVSIGNARSYASLESQVARRTEQLAQANQRLEQLSYTDALTGLANRRQLDVVLAQEWRHAVHTAAPIAVAMADIDHFKAYNDRYGHLRGDRCLRWVARLCDQLSRGTDLAARYGGDEIVVVMPDTDLTAAIRNAERLRAAVAAARAPHPLNAQEFVTICVGVAAAHPRPQDDLHQLTAAADAALYQAKRLGRNRVHPAVGDDSPRES